MRTKKCLLSTLTLVRKERNETKDTEKLIKYGHGHQRNTEITDDTI